MGKLLPDAVYLVGESLEGSANRLENLRGVHIMKAVEDSVRVLQLRHFLYGLKGRTRVSVY